MRSSLYALTAALSTCITTTSAQSQSAADILTIYQRSIPLTALTYPVKGGQAALETYINNATASGQYSSVDYTAGCAGRRANWPAQEHWTYTLYLAEAYVDSLPHTASLTQTAPYNFVGNATVKTIIDSAMNYWFANDFTNLACVDQGGLTNNTCPCGTPGLWNSNWFDNIIQIPEEATATCLLMNATLTDAQRASCINIGQRAYNRISTFVYGIGLITGANTLDVAAVGINTGILQYYSNDTQAGLNLIADAYKNANGAISVTDGIKADGILPDGSFGQHEGILYDGNYGADFTTALLALELEAAGTPYAANATSKAALELDLAGSWWMIYRNIKTQVLHWDVSTIGRFVSFPVSDKQATANLNLNLTQIQELGQQWNSTAVANAAAGLMQNGTTANAGNLIGNRMFWSNDYMVNRGSKYVTTVKMLSSRTVNTECLNLQNPLGFHLGQGAVYTYVTGEEYEDIAAAWDWNIIPGITTDYGVTPLICNTTAQTGNRTFVGGASNGRVGVAAMDYLNPLTGSFAYRKAWFFLEDNVQHVAISGIVSNTNATVYSVLDQKKANGPVYVDSKLLAAGQQNSTTACTLWHDQIGYDFCEGDSGFGTDSGLTQLSVAVANRTGNWSTIGISTVGVETVEMFTALLQHNPTNLTAPAAYSMYPGTHSNDEFQTKAKRQGLQSVQNDDTAAAVFDPIHGTATAVFWQSGGGLVDFHSFSIQSDQSAIVIFDINSGKLTVSDPTQSLQTVTLTFGCLSSSGKSEGSKRSKQTKTVAVTLPTGGAAGSSTTTTVAGWNSWLEERRAWRT